MRPLLAIADPLDDNYLLVEVGYLRLIQRSMPVLFV